MFILVVIGAIFISIAALAGLYFTSYTYNHLSTDWMTSHNMYLQEHGLSLSILEANEHLFNTKKKYILSLNQDFFSKYQIPIQLKDSVGIIFDQECQIIPLFVSCIQKVRLTKQHPFQEKFFNQWQLTWDLSYIPITSKIQSEINLINKNGHKIKEATINFESSKDLKYNTFTFKTPKILSRNKNKEKISVKDVEVVFFMDKINNEWSYQNHIAAEFFEIISNENKSIMVDNLDLIFKNQGAQSANKNHLKASKVVTKKHNKSIVLEKFSLDFSTSGINPEGALFIDVFLNYINKIHQEKIDDFFEIINKETIHLKINKLSTIVNDKNIVGQGEITLPAYKRSAEGMEHLIKSIKGFINLYVQTFSKNNKLENQLTKEKNNNKLSDKDMESTESYKTNIKIENGMISSNQKIIDVLYK